MELDVLQRYTRSSEGADARQVCRTCCCVVTVQTRPCRQFGMLVTAMIDRRFPNVIPCACVVLRGLVPQVSPHSLQSVLPGATRSIFCYFCCNTFVQTNCYDQCCKLFKELAAHELKYDFDVVDQNYVILIQVVLGLPPTAATLHTLTCEQVMEMVMVVAEEFDE